MPTSTTTTYGPVSSAYNLIPTPTQGSGTAYGSVPGVLGLPNPAGDLSVQIPGLTNLNKTASGDILANLEGTLSPGTQKALQNASATFGVQSGMPDSGLSWNQLYGNIAGASESQQQQGLQELNPFLTQTSGTQTVSPALQTQIAATNASNLAAPSPTAAASYSQQLFDQYLQQMKGPAGGTGGAGNPALSATSSSPLSGPNGPLNFDTTGMPSASGTSGTSGAGNTTYINQPDSTGALLQSAGYGDLSSNYGFSVDPGDYSSY